MTTIPVELAAAREARTEAWDRYQVVIDREHTPDEFDAALAEAQAADRVAERWYRRWQRVGGTSDIQSIVESECASEPATIEEAVRMVYGEAQEPRIVDGVSSPEWWRAQKEVNPNE